jgi:hypothetical protein
VMISARPKYQVFISSTYADLREEREAVTWAVLSARHIPVGMEAFTATDDRGWQTIKSVIDRSDYYVLLLAGRYGSTDKEGLSWTEKEYEYAASKKIPILVFIRSKASITADQLDDDPPLKKRLEAFKKRVRDKHHCIEWATTEKLVSFVSVALRNHVMDDEDAGTPRPGWYRGDELPRTATLDEFARLSSETERLKNELQSLHTFMAEAPSLSLVDRNKLDVIGRHKTIRILKKYNPGLNSLQRMMQYTSEADFGADNVVLNTVIIFELGIKNIGKSLIEHITLDVTFAPVLGFGTGAWSGVELVKNHGILSGSKFRGDAKGTYSEYARLDEANQITLRFRVERISVGGTEYIPALLVVGRVDNERAFFTMKYTIAGSIGSAVNEQCVYEIEFNGGADVGDDGKRKDEALLRRYISANLGKLLLPMPRLSK